jgi:hypothetical protein
MAPTKNILILYNPFKIDFQLMRRCFVYLVVTTDVGTQVVPSREGVLIDSKLISLRVLFVEKLIQNHLHGACHSQDGGSIARRHT